MDRPVLDPLVLAEAVRIKQKEREDMLNICQSSLVRKMQGRTGEIIERPGWRIANDSEARGGCIASNCPEVAPFICPMDICKAYCCSIHGPDHQLHTTWATLEALTIQRDQRRAAMAVGNQRGRGRGGAGTRGGARGGARVRDGDRGGTRAGARTGARAGARNGRGAIEGRGLNVVGHLEVDRVGNGEEVEQPLLRVATPAGGRGNGRGGSGRTSGRGRTVQQGVAGIEESESSALTPSDEANPLALLAALLRSHPNLLSQLSSMDSTDEVAENILDEWII